MLSGLGLLSNFGNSLLLGYVAVGGTFAYVVLLLVVSAIRSDTTYDYQGWWYKHPYKMMPSKIVAPPFVFLLYVSVWLGFSGVHASNVKVDGAVRYTASEARSLSLATLLTLDFPDDSTHGALTPEVRAAVLQEIACGFLLVVIIFALLINRVSDWPSGRVS